MRFRGICCFRIATFFRRERTKASHTTLRDDVGSRETIIDKNKKLQPTRSRISQPLPRITQAPQHHPALRSELEVASLSIWPS